METARKTIARSKLVLRYLVCFLVICAFSADKVAQQIQASNEDLSSMIIKDLMNEPVTSVSRQDQKMSQMAAVVFVMGQEGIRHSEATTIPGLLRIVPGLDAAQINSNARADSAREFDSQSANKRLVLA